MATQSRAFKGGFREADSPRVDSSAETDVGAERKESKHNRDRDKTQGQNGSKDRETITGLCEGEEWDKPYYH